MGMYTLLHLDCKLKSDTPAEGIENLMVMTVVDYEGMSKEFVADIIKPDHPFFGCSRWQHMLLSSSAYFDEETNSSIFLRDGIYRLQVMCNFKNYNNEINLFMDWLNPYIDAPIGAKLGFSRYEEDTENTAILKK